MGLIETRESVKIINIRSMWWESSKVYVAPRPYHALAFRIKGNAVFTHGEKVLNSSPGTVTYMPANYDYSAQYPDRNEILVIHFQLKKDLEIENFSPLSSAAVFSLFKNAYKTWKEGGNCYYDKTMSLFYEILCNLPSADRHSKSSPSYKSFLSASEYMRENFTDPNLSIEQLAKSANISGTYFRKLFLQKFNTTPNRYLILKRLTYADKLLSTGKYSIKEVAEMSGFYDVKYFSRVVKKEYGVPPSKLYCHITTNDMSGSDGFS
ncbi:MAG: helix-turn-helix transcriptional regulator [Clostridia bacterium]|nr:helix-turn-helix transcriptional regulator [Clostridia bacterium]